eukprot:CAMPEP_0114051446 /NCGR_PEP_ID=MMETSP1339-20121228/70168_1 /TAXON_ID=94617 /ORGANISM="Fibrocapsa japonica" /LENGTH=47 /assembly_acc=CAM_ASM_000762
MEVTDDIKVKVSHVHISDAVRTMQNHFMSKRTAVRFLHEILAEKKSE